MRLCRLIILITSLIPSLGQIAQQHQLHQPLHSRQQQHQNLVYQYINNHHHRHATHSHAKLQPKSSSKQDVGCITPEMNVAGVKEISTSVVELKLIPTTSLGAMTKNAISITKTNDVLIDPTHHHPKCLEIVHSSLFSTEECNLSSQCGRVITRQIASTWYGNKVRVCIGTFIDDIPEAYNHNWAQVYKINWKVSSPTQSCLESFVLLKVYHGWRLMSKYYLDNYFVKTNEISPFKNVYVPKIMCHLCVTRPIAFPTISKIFSTQQEALDFNNPSTTNQCQIIASNGQHMVLNLDNTTVYTAKQTTCSIKYDQMTGSPKNHSWIHTLLNAILDYIENLLSILIKTIIDVIITIGDYLESKIYFYEYMFIILLLLTYGLTLTQTIGIVGLLIFIITGLTKEIADEL